VQATDPKLNVARAIQERKILLVELGDLTSTQRTFATLLLSKIRQAFDRNTKLQDWEMVPFYVYCDEFQEFQTSDFKDMLARAGGLNLCLTLANQYPKQLDSDLWDAIFKNVATYFLFQLDPEDTARFKHYFPPVVKDVHREERDRLRRKYDQIAGERQAMIEWYKNYIDGADSDDRKEAKKDRDAHFDEYTRKLQSIGERLERFGKPFGDSPDYQTELIRMPTGQCIYIPVTGDVCKIATPKPLSERNPRSLAEAIKRDTIEHYSAPTVDRSPEASAKYAELARNRTVQNYSCDPHQRVATKGDAPSGSERGKDGGPANRAPQVPSHKGKENSPRDSR